MCRFYALRATAPTRAECGWSSRPTRCSPKAGRTSNGFEHADGWGSPPTAGGGRGRGGSSASRSPAHDGRGVPRRRGPVEGPHGRSRTCAARRSARTLPENTHPFAYGPWTFVHNGTVPYFAEVQDALLNCDQRAAPGCDRRADRQRAPVPLHPLEATSRRRAGRCSRACSSRSGRSSPGAARAVTSRVSGSTSC